ncbi:MAG: hypothetical protein Q9180_003505, partial [Flavoplaca navasiana]
LKLNYGHFLIEDNSASTAASTTAPPATSAVTASIAHVAKGVVEDIRSNSSIKSANVNAYSTLTEQHQELAALAEQHQKEPAKQHQEELASLAEHWQLRYEAWQHKHEKLKQLHIIQLRETQAKLNQDHHKNLHQKLHEQKQSYEQKIQEMQAQITALSPAPTPPLAISPTNGIILPPSPPATPILAPTATLSYEKPSMSAQAVENSPPTTAPTPPPSYHRTIPQFKHNSPTNLATPHEKLYVPPQKRARRAYMTIQDLFTKFGST